MAGKRGKEREDEYGRRDRGDEYGNDRADEHGSPAAEIDDYGRPGGGRKRDDHGRSFESGYGTVAGSDDSRGWPGRRSLTDGLSPRAADAVIPLMESAFGRSFAGVRVRTDDEAAAKADSMGARAWAEGDEIGFARGEFAPDTRQGLHTIAHEFAHVAQGRGVGAGGGAARAKAIGGIDQGDAVEADADAAADAVVAGERPEVEEVALGLHGKPRSEAPAITPPPRGSVAVGRDAGAWILTFPGDDVRLWTGDARMEPLFRAAQQPFPGITRDHVGRFLKEERRNIGFGPHFNPKKWKQPILIVRVEPDLMVSLRRWIGAHPELGLAPGPVTGATSTDDGENLFTRAPGMDRQRFPAKATLEIAPEPKRHITGGFVDLEVVHDMSETDLDRWILLVPGHASYNWSIRRQGATQPYLASPFKPQDFYTDDRRFKMPIPAEPGTYRIEVTPHSQHFTETAPLHRHIFAVQESALDRQVFAETLAGAGNPFERGADGKLTANPEAQYPTPEDEQTRLSVQQGMADGLHAQGTIGDRDHAAYTGQQKKKMAAQARIAMANIGREPYLIHGSFLSRDSGQSMPLTLVMYGRGDPAMGFGGDGATYSLTVHDSSLDGTRPAQHRGKGSSFKSDPDEALAEAEQQALANLWETWHKANDYPAGSVHVAVQLHEGERPVVEHVIDTDSWVRTGRSALGTIANVAGLALLVLPGGGVLSAGLLIVSGVAGTAETIMALQHRADTQGLHADGQLALDLLNVATNLAGAGGLTKTIHYGSGLVRGMYYGTMIGLTGAQGYLIAKQTQAALAILEAESAAEIAMAPPERQPDLRKQRDHAVARLMGDAIISSGFLVVSLTGVLKEASVKGEMRTFVEELGARGSITDLENLIANHENGKVPLTPAELAHIETMLAGARTTGQPGDKGGDEPPTRPPGETPSGGAKRSRTVREEGNQVAVDSLPNNVMDRYGHLTASDFASAADPRLQEIHQAAKAENIRVTNELRKKLEALGIPNIEIGNRAKSPVTILGKLKETPGMKVSDITDLSGIRINITDINSPNFSQANDIVRAIKEVLNVPEGAIKDYNKKPNSWGYTGRVHVFPPGEGGIALEIQVGSRDLSEFIEMKFKMPDGRLVELHDLTGYKGNLYGTAVTPELQTAYTQLIGDIARANREGKDIAEVPALQAAIKNFQAKVAHFLDSLPKAIK